MTMSPNDRSSAPLRSSRGFTLAEIMIGAAIGVFVIAGLLTSYLLIIRSGYAISNYAEMDQQSRKAIEQFGIDARMASAFVSKTNSSGAVISVTFTVPDNYTSTSNEVTYAYDAADEWFYLVPGDGSSLSGQQILARDVTSLAFNRLDSSGAATSSDSTAKVIQCVLTLTRTAVTSVPVTQTGTGTFVMRNKS